MKNIDFFNDQELRMRLRDLNKNFVRDLGQCRNEMINWYCAKTMYFELLDSCVFTFWVAVSLGSERQASQRKHLNTPKIHYLD